VASVILPNRQDASWYRFVCDLDGLTFAFVFRWNDRDNAWSFDLYDVNNNLLLAGVKVVLGPPLMFGQRYVAGMPPGMFEVVDNAAPLGAVAAGTDAGYADLGTRVVIMYTPVADLRAAGVAV
jgi:hypothetical protein